MASVLTCSHRLQGELSYALGDIAHHLHDDTLRERTLRSLDIRDTSRAPAVPLAHITPLLMDAFHARWRLARLHQGALLRAVDAQGAGTLQWDAFGMAALLMSETGAQAPYEQAEAFETFQAACKVTGKPDCCTLEHARMKLAIRYGRLWALDKLLPQECEIRDGVSVLPPGFEEQLQARGAALQEAISSTAKVWSLCKLGSCQPHPGLPR